ncbi:MAG: hypothetical protein ASARMPRED_004001 [Alectoria sarmentosa]|nr:MAG: hypothetical protein ASARMPRED_004001 [Alectoria sarmentosa]
MAFQTKDMDPNIIVGLANEIGWLQVFVLKMQIMNYRDRLASSKTQLRSTKRIPSLSHTKTFQSAQSPFLHRPSTISLPPLLAQSPHSSDASSAAQPGLDISGVHQDDHHALHLKSIAALFPILLTAAFEVR